MSIEVEITSHTRGRHRKGPDRPGGEAELPELLLGPLPPLRPVGGHDEDVVLQQRPRPRAGVGRLRHHRLAGDELPALRQRLVAVVEDRSALVVGPRRQDPLEEEMKIGIKCCSILTICSWVFGSRKFRV